MRRAFISDIHGNLEALEAVLEDIRARGVAEVVCLGDIVGFGPNPRECVDRVMETCGVTIMGNHDADALSDRRPSGIEDERRVFWMRHQLDPSWDRANARRREFLASLPSSYQVGPYLLVHGSPRNPPGEYIFPEDIYNHRKMERLFQLVDHYCFQGHTHVPGIFTEDFQFCSPDEIDQEYSLGIGKLMINVGSVGQPRDGDDRACYVILDDDPRGDVDAETHLPVQPTGTPRVEFHRISYDFDTTIGKIRDLWP